ncbi:uncharacterized protein [Diadema antillarum]|uniref:uncharacterized protein n=1 Tax=Diadema antillarum TaxID=105358 RepID=UPI003A886BA0
MSTRNKGYLKTGATSSRNGATPDVTSASPSRHGDMGVATSHLFSLEHGDHVTDTDRALLEQFTEQEIRDLKAVFNVFDKEQRGYIDAFELRRALRVLGFKLSHRETDEAIVDLGRGIIGEINFKDFLDLVAHRQGDSRDIYAEINQGFDMMDYGKKGCLTVEDLKLVAKEVGVKVSDTMLREMVEEADTTGDNKINRDEFVAVMLQTNMYKE